MWQRIKEIWTYHKIALLALLVVIAAAGFFGSRAVSQMVYWSDPAKLDQPLQGWMTPRYVGRSYKIPPEVVQSAFNLERPAVPRRISLETIAAEQGATLEELQSRLDAAVAAFRMANGQ